MIFTFFHQVNLSLSLCSASLISAENLHLPIGLRREIVIQLSLTLEKKNNVRVQQGLMFL